MSEHVRYPDVVLVTGAAAGMGASHARALGARGVHVCVADVADPAETTEKILADGGSASAHRLDVTVAGQWAAVLAEIRERHGSLGGLVNNAGISRRLEFLDTTAEVWDEVLAVNLTGPFHGMRAAAPLMRDSGGGSIVNISSISGQIGYFSPAYSASKWGLTGLSKSAAGNFARWGIRVNSVHPRTGRNRAARGRGHLRQVRCGQCARWSDGEAGRDHGRGAVPALGPIELHDRQRGHRRRRPRFERALPPHRRGVGR
ncbi:hypothetical protein GCM10009754_31270 [Amycolatopsis minnesotensis]|uniref:Ketoreductase domain-containing protein n=1 Tax=Amycolatopsis minnesotensis TaxID=337894 RepID=A0ABP5C984_9PSEU